MAGMSILRLVASFIRSLFKSHRQLLLENLALKQQLAMLQLSVKRPRASVTDRNFWILFSRYVDGWRNTLHALHADTVVRWHRQGFRLYWRWKSRGPRPGRPPILCVFIVLSHDRRQVVYFNATEHPTAYWTAQQLVEAFPFDSAPLCLLRDRDEIYGEKVQRRIRSLGIDEIISAPATARLLPRASLTMAKSLC
jgi:hypothetical protein